MSADPKKKLGQGRPAPPKKSNAFDLMDDPNIPMLADDEPLDDEEEQKNQPQLEEEEEEDNDMGFIG